MDEQLRANPDDLVTLMRAGRLSRERVAMAVYLGDERALATGVEPWEPPEPPQGVRTLVKFGQFTSRERTWLACLCVAHVLQANKATPPLWRLVQVTSRWCQGSEPPRAVRRALRTLTEGGTYTEPAQRTPYSVGAATEAAQSALSGSDTRPAVAAVHFCRVAMEVRGEAERAWQAQAIATVLLDPDWPLWDED